MTELKSHQYRGRLEEMPLPEMMATVLHYGVAGVVQATSGEVVKRLFVRNGVIVHATTSDISESLGCFLLSQGRLEKDEFRSTMRQRRTSEQRYGVLLIEQGLISPAGLCEALRDHAAELVWSLFEWTRGDVTFAVGDFSDPLVGLLNLPLRLAVKEGVKRIVDVEPLFEKLALEGPVLTPDYCLEDLIEIALTGDEFSLLRMVDGERSLKDLCQAGPFDAMTNGRLLYAFKVLKLVRPAQPSKRIKVTLKTEST